MKDMDNESITKELEAALKDFKEKISQVPEGYFDQFDAKVLAKIHTEEQRIQQAVPVPKLAPSLPLLLGQKKYLVAASLILVVATGYLLNYQMEKKLAPAIASIQIEALSDDAIELYVSNNELMAEVEWNTAIETTSEAILLNNNP